MSNCLLLLVLNNIIQSAATVSLSRWSNDLSTGTIVDKMCQLHWHFYGMFNHVSTRSAFNCQLDVYPGFTQSLHTHTFSICEQLLTNDPSLSAQMIHLISASGRDFDTLQCLASQQKRISEIVQIPNEQFHAYSTFFYHTKKADPFSRVLQQLSIVTFPSTPSHHHRISRLIHCSQSRVK